MSVKSKARNRRHMHIRKRISGTAETPRMAVFRSAKHIYVQLIDDVAEVTLLSTSTVEKAVVAEIGSKPKMEAAIIIGKVFGEKAVQSGITKIVFDRGGFRYHGRVKALADAAREAGLQF
jgi:large subunit ribosomal protein L18